MSLYIALDNVGLDWKDKDVERFRQYWSQGYSLNQIAKMLKRPQKDVFALILDQSTEGLIEERYGGVFGHEWTGESIKKSS